MATLKIKLTGAAPLLMHSERLVDPTNEHTKRVAEMAKRAKSSKTEAAYAALKRAEWEGGMYLDEKGRPCIPASNILAALGDGARKSKQGKAVKSGVFCAVENFALEYDGPTKLDELFADGRFIDYRGTKVTTARVMRCRPRFPEWSCVVEIVYIEEVIARETVLRAFELGGMLAGIGDYRPQHGRFSIEVVSG